VTGGNRVAHRWAREYLATLKDELNDGAEIPSVEVSEAPAFARTSESVTHEATDSSGPETHCDGWFKVTFAREGERFVTVEFVVQSMNIVDRRGEHADTVTLDGLG